MLTANYINNLFRDVNTKTFFSTKFSLFSNHLEMSTHQLNLVYLAINKLLGSK